MYTKSELSFHVGLAYQLLKLESDAIDRASRHLKAQDLEKALDTLSDCLGKVILTGVGKSGIVAQKIAATLTSTGTLAIYLHPCDALHGDFGIVTRDDVVIMLSNSGETDELIGLLPHLKLRQVPIIAIIGNLKSTLARQATVALDASVDREACPLNLAPTTSTTVALAIGDALAMTLMQMKGLTAEDFAFNHPAGRLGKRLTLRVADLMHGGTDYPKLSPAAGWVDLLCTLSQGGFGAVNVVDKYDYLLGVITDGDLRRWIRKTQSTEWDTLTAGHIMTPDPVVVTPDLLAYDALKLMEERESQISILPVVDAEQRSIGILRLHDIVRSGL